MEIRGKVVKVCNEFVYVQIKRTTSCGKDCSRCIGCNPAGMTLKIENRFNVQEGDRVRVISNRSSLTEAVLYVYVIPLTVFIMSYLFILSRFTETGIVVNYELIALVGAFGVMMLCYQVVKRLSMNFSKEKRYNLELQKAPELIE